MAATVSAIYSCDDPFWLFAGWMCCVTAERNSGCSIPPAHAEGLIDLEECESSALNSPALFFTSVLPTEHQPIALWKSRVITLLVVFLWFRRFLRYWLPNI